MVGCRIRCLRAANAGSSCKPACRQGRRAGHCEAVPEFGVFVGPDGVRQFMHRFLEQWKRMTIEAKHLEVVGDTVLAHVVLHQEGRTSGVTGEQSSFMLFTFRGRKIIRIESVLHKAKALEAVGLSG